MIPAQESRALLIGPRSRLAGLLLVLIAVAAGSLVGANTRWDVGLRGDSCAHLSGARSLAAGLGYSRTSGAGEVKPITHFPPLYSLLLASPEDRTLIEALSAGLQVTGRNEAGVILMEGNKPMSGVCLSGAGVRHGRRWGGVSAR